MTESTPTGVTSQLTDGTAAGRWVLDPAGSRAEFRIKHFWGIMTVRGLLEQLAGDATVSPDGMVTGRISFEAASINTGNKQRDKHLRSKDFFDAENHAQAVLTVTSAAPVGPDQLRCQGTFEAAGHSRPVAFDARLRDASAQSVVADAELTVDRTEFGMTWSPLHMTPATAIGHVTARFIRS